MIYYVLDRTREYTMYTYTIRRIVRVGLDPLGITMSTVCGSSANTFTGEVTSEVLHGPSAAIFAREKTSRSVS